MAFFQKMKDFYHSPGNVCYLCGTKPSPHLFEYVLDTGISIEFEGSLQFCNQCCVRVGKEAGMLVPKEVAELKAQVMKAEAARARAENNWRRADAALKAVREYEDGDDNE